MATARSVLVITATSGFGELIQRTLEETGLYKVMLVDSDQEALLCIQTVAFNIAILDAELPGGSMIRMAANMRHKLPKMRLVIICSEDDPAYPAAVAFQPAGLLSKPFYFPDLLDVIAKALQTPVESTQIPTARAIQAAPTAAIPAAPPAPEWLQDANWAARHLTRLSLESSAQAALIVRDGILWAYAGELSQTATNELVESLTAFWDIDPGLPAYTPSLRSQLNDMVRFIHLDATQGDYMLYATSLGQGMVLSLIFEADTPFSTIRSQASYLSRGLAAPPGTPLPPYPKSTRAVNQPVELQDAEAYAFVANLPPILDDVPPPSPHQRSPVPAGKEHIPSWFEEASAPPSLTEAALSHQSPPPIKPVQIAPEKPPTIHTDSTINKIPEQSFADKLPLYSENNEVHPSLASRVGDADGLPNPNPHVTEKTPMVPDLLPGSPTLHYLTYSCAIIPRLPQHQLGGDLAHLLQEWVPQLFMAFGWQMIDISVLPEYLQVIARVSPNTSAGSFVRIIRQQTSRRIFTAFPRIAQDNPSSDFWAPGYLILSSAQRPPEHVIRHFIDQTRTQQGAPKKG
jgi:DNA-binding NarL/FixJ family response regulator/REP element-mobilizing transposase RayT